MILPQTNATITRVQAGGSSEDFDHPAGAGAAKWQGTVGVYLHERSDRVQGAQETSVVITRSLIVPGDLPVAWQQADTITLNRAGRVSTVTVRDIERSEINGLSQRTVRLILEDQ